MSKHSKIGIKGEQIAEGFLLNKGYYILHRNWRAGKKEIDLIAIAEGVIVFAEVKARTGTRFIFPEEAVNQKKREFLKAAALIFMDTYPGNATYRFDIISVLFDAENIKEIAHFEDAF